MCDDLEDTFLVCIIGASYDTAVIGLCMIDNAIVPPVFFLILLDAVADALHALPSS